MAFSVKMEVEVLGLLLGLGLHELLIYLRLSTGFGMLVFFTKLSLMEFWVRYEAFFFLFSVMDGFMAQDGKFLQEYPVNTGVSQCLFFAFVLVLL